MVYIFQYFFFRAMLTGTLMEAAGGLKEATIEAEKRPKLRTLG